jgi:hypothetical protein
MRRTAEVYGSAWPRPSRGLAEAFIWLVEILSTAVVSSNSLLTVLPGPGVGLRVFSSAPVVAAVSAALWCRDWRLVPSVAAPLLAAGRVTVGVGVRPLGRLGRSGRQWLLKGSGISYKLPLIRGAASHYLKRNCLPLAPAGFNP